MRTRSHRAPAPMAGQEVCGPRVEAPQTVCRGKVPSPASQTNGSGRTGLSGRRPDDLLLISRNDFQALIFDLDGVLADTTPLHTRTWTALFEEYGRRRASSGLPFDSAFFAEKDYALLAGLSRFDGVRRFLDSRSVVLPWGNERDPAHADTICGLGNRKNALFLRLLQQQGVDACTPNVAFAREARRRGFRLALVSGSRNSYSVLNRLGLEDLFHVRLDARDAAHLRLEGKPSPDLFLLASRMLGASPEEAAVFEDGVSGVRAAKEGGFGRIVGILDVRVPDEREAQATGGALPRDGHAAGDALLREGADVVVAHLRHMRLSGRPGRMTGQDVAPRSIRLPR